jgi:hypothetical protein
MVIAFKLSKDPHHQRAAFDLCHQPLQPISRFYVVTVMAWQTVEA